ncbi:MAG: acyltransferase family protein [Actinobacteria bacterium]|uniref:Unannotated protein n=1 Tax=freshwater metagenome TaxID=449393 RepID=A0A6J7MS80_9ZZZZ|nr:acyltransferase family protein [Actinomycetota bacterium]
MGENLTAENPPRGAKDGVRRLGQVPGLDGVRGIAVLSVVIYHFVYKSGAGGAPALIPNTPFAISLRSGIVGGWLGVDIFFVLSGFLITAILLDEQGLKGKIRFGAFYMRRALRLLPALYALLAIYAVYSLTTGLPYYPWWQSSLGIIFYYTNWLGIYNPAGLARGTGIFWSLAVEEQFYLIWPVTLFLFFGINRRARVVIPGIIAMILFIAVRRALMVDSVGWVSLLSRTDTRIDSLLVGALFAQLWVRNLTPRRGLRVASTIAVGVVAFSIMIGKVGDSRWYAYGLTVIAVLVAIGILGIVEGVWENGGIFGARPLRLLGRVSYGLYIWHTMVIDTVTRYGSTWGWGTRLVVSVAATATVVWLSWTFIETPALRLKRRWEVRGIGPSPAVGEIDLAVTGHPRALSPETN